MFKVKFLRFLSNEKADVIIDSSGASTVSILETILSPQGRKELRDMAEFAEQHNIRQPRLKIYSSFNNIIPTKDLDGDEYSVFLSYASDIELDTDTVSQATYYKMCKALNKPLPKPQFPIARMTF
jgi:hypothetical protein